LHKVAASAAWKDDQTLEMLWRYYESPHHDSVTCEFEGSQVTIKFLNSITKTRGQTQDQRTPLTGRLAA
jgi:hypothetical protein